MPLHRRTRDWYVELDSNQHTCDVNASGNLSHHRRIGLARVVGIEPTCTGFKAQTDLHVIPQLFGTSGRTRTCPAGLEGPSPILRRRCCLVGPLGFEPRPGGLKVRCANR